MFLQLQYTDSRQGNRAGCAHTHHVITSTNADSRHSQPECFALPSLSCSKSMQVLGMEYRAVARFTRKDTPCFYKYNI